MNFRIYIKKRLLDGTWSDPLCIQDSFMGIKEEMLVDPTLTKKKSSAGSFEAGVHFDNIALQTTDPKGQPWLEKGNTRVFIKAFKDKYDMPGLVTGISMIPDEQDKGQIIWDGRILSCDTDFYNQPKIHAEGSLSFFGDTLQPKKVFMYGKDGVNHPRDIFNKIVEAHNEKDTSTDYITNIRFVPNTSFHVNGKEQNYGTVWPDTWVKEDESENGETKQATRLSIGDESTLSALTKFLNAFGGGIRVVWKWTMEGSPATSKWVRYVEWITEDYDMEKQSDPSMVQFSVNLIDMTRKTDASAVATCIMPRGYKAYSGGSWAIGDDMFAMGDYPGPGNNVERPRTTWTAGVSIVKYRDTSLGDYADNVYYDAVGAVHNTMATGWLLSGRATGSTEELDSPVQPGEVYIKDENGDPIKPWTYGYAAYRNTIDDVDYASAYYRDPPDRGLVVEPGEVYYVSLEQSDGRVTYVVTIGALGTNPALAYDVGTAGNGTWPKTKDSNNITEWDHHKLEIKKPSDAVYEKGIDLGLVHKNAQGKYELNNNVKMYLNISSRMYTDGVYHASSHPWWGWSYEAYGVDPTVRDLVGDDDVRKPGSGGKVGIWKGRKVLDGLDEYITLKGLDNGSYSSYFYTVTTINTSASGVQTSTSKEIVIDCPKQNQQDPRGVNEGVNGEFSYPYNKTGMGRGSVSTVNDLPDPTTVPTDTWYDVVSEDNKYVAIQTSTGVNRWYPQRKFYRDGYYVYDPEAVKQYGRIEKIIDISDAHNPKYLEAAAAQTLYNAKFEAYSLDMSAIDAQLLTEDAQLSKILDVMDPVYVHSAYHGVSVMLPIEELELPFNDLGSMSYSLSFTTTQRITSSITTKKR